MARDLGVDRGSLRARVVAAAAAAALIELERLLRQGRRRPDDPMAVFDEVFAFVRGGVEALARPLSVRPARTAGSLACWL